MVPTKSLAVIAAENMASVPPIEALRVLQNTPAAHIAAILEISQNTLQMTSEQSRQRELDRAYAAERRSLALQEREKIRAHELAMKQADIRMAKLALLRKKRPVASLEHEESASAEDTMDEDSASVSSVSTSVQAKRPRGEKTFDLELWLQSMPLEGHPPGSRTNQRNLSAEIYAALQRPGRPVSAIDVYKFLQDIFIDVQQSLFMFNSVKKQTITPHCVCKQSTICALWAPLGDKHRLAVDTLVTELTRAAEATLFSEVVE